MQLRKVFFIALLPLVSTNSYGVFCEVLRYALPGTGNEVWLFGDVHLDIEKSQILTRLHQHVVLAAAKRRNALMIIENTDAGSYRPCLYGALLGSMVYALGDKMYKKEYSHVCGYAFGAAILGYSWYSQWELTTKPTVSFGEYWAQKKRLNHDYFFVLDAATPLTQLKQRAEALKIRAIDAECRFHDFGVVEELERQKVPWYQRSARTSNALYNGIMRRISGDVVRYQTTVSDYCAATQSIFKEIEAYQDPTALKTFYKECIENYKLSYISRQMLMLKQVNPHLELIDVVPRISKEMKKKSSDVCDAFILHNRTLLDARLLHIMYQNRQEKTIFICAGAAHTERIAPLLSQLGYMRVGFYGKGNLSALCDKGILDTKYISVRDLDCLAVNFEKIPL